MRNKNFVICAIFIFMSALLNAQSHNEEITVEGSYNPQIKKSERIIKTPNMPKKEFSIPKYEVNTEDFTYNYKIDLEPVSPINYISGKSEETINNFVKAGFGTRLSPEFLFRHYSSVSKSTSLGVGILHNSTWTDMKSYENTKYMNNAFSVSMTNRFSQLQLHSYVDYHYDMYNLRDNEDPRRFIHSLNAGVSANNNRSSYKSLYDEFWLDYNYSGIQGGMQENLLKFKAHLEHSNSWFKYGNNTQTLTLDIDAEVNNIKQTLFVISVNPHLNFNGDYYNVQFGLRLDAKTNSTNMGGIYPDIKGSLYILNKDIEFYAGLGGKTKINTLKEILSENPFIVSNLDNFGELDYEKTKIAFQGGLKFKAINMISGHVGVRYRKVDNLILYTPSYDNQGTFDMTIDNNTCSVFNFLADINFRVNDKINIAADFSYNNYKRAEGLSAWYKPKFESKIKGIYNLNDYWNFNIAAYIEGKRDALDYQGNSIELKPICDIQLGCDYNYNKDLSFYAEMKNLIHNKYQIYYDYPSYGFQVFIGLKYRFL